MERAQAELITRTHSDIRYEVVSSTLAAELRPLVAWRRIPVPARPFPLKFAAFYLAAGIALRRRSPGIVHTCGAIVPNRVDVASVHFCHAGFRRASAGAAGPSAGLLRRLNAASTRVISLAAERLTYGRTRRPPLLACVSRGIQAEVAGFYPGAPTTFTPNGVDHGRFARDDVARDELRRAEGATDDDIVLLFVGGDWSRKGLGLAIEAVASSRRETGRRLVLWVVGEGDEPEYSRLAADAGAHDAVTFFGRRDDTERFYSAADVFLLPSLYEAFPLVAMEAAAAGLPVVGSPVHGVSEVVAGGGGLAVDRSSASLARAITDLSADEGLRRELGSAARVFISDFTWTRSGESVLDAYRAADESRRRRAG